MSDSFDPSDGHAQTNGEAHTGEAPGVPDVSSGDGAPESQAPAEDSFPIVGIGASAGGLKAIQEFFTALPESPGMAFVIVQHLSPDHESALAELIQTKTRMVVSQVDDHPDVAPDRVYVIPPGKHLEIENGRLQLVELKRDRGRPAAIDHFFRSLADDAGARAVCIVLSGTGSDGSLGLKAVKERTGLTMAQSVEDAEHDGMPRSAIGTGLVDFQGTAAELAEKLTSIRERSGEALLVMPDEEPVDDRQALQSIFAHLRRRTDHDFTNYKRATIRRRLARRLQVTNQPDLPSYAQYLRQTPDEVHALLRDFLISVTQFFRDPEAFDVLEQKVIPAIFDGKGPQDQVRVWVAGCATGEEAYSVAMLLCEYHARLDHGPALQVFATDIDDEALAQAREGLYARVAAADLSPERLRRFFEVEPGGIRVKPELREIVLFTHHNLISDPPFSRLCLVTCRNVLIYLNRGVQAHTFGSFHYALQPDGYLFLGSSEGPDAVAKGFVEVDKTARLYQRRDGVQPRMPRFSVNALHHGPVPRPRDPVASPPRQGLVERYRDWTVQTYAPPRLLVDEQFDITHVFGAAGAYLQDREGPVTQNVIDKVVRAFRIDLRSALHRAFAKGESTDTAFQRVEIGGAERVTRLHVGPVGGAAAQDGLAEVVFVELDPATVRLLGVSVAERSDTEDPSVARLEEELRRSRAQLQATIEDQEASNEELKASNEELQSINEELQSTTEELETSKEELQSMNEELTTVNQELRAKIDEAARSNADLRNLLSATGIGTVYLDRALRLKRYTPGASEIFHVIPSDLGRPFAHITHELLGVDLSERAARVLETLVPEEVEIASSAGAWYLARIIPYRTSDDRIDGVVMSFVAITEQKRARDEAARRAEQQAAVAEIGRLALTDAPLSTLFERAVEAAAAGIGADYAKVLRHRPEQHDLMLEAGCGWNEAEPGVTTVPDDDGSQAGFTLLAADPVIVQDLLNEERFAGPDLLLDHEVRSGISACIPGAAGETFGVLGVHSREAQHFSQDDVQFVQTLALTLGGAVRRAADEQTIRSQLAEIEAVYGSAPVGLAFLDRDLRYVRINTRLAEINGVPIGDHVGKTTREIVPNLADQLEGYYERVMASGVAIEDLEVVGHTQRDPTDERVWLCSFVPQTNAAGTVDGLSIVVRDITERKEMERELAATAANLDIAMAGGKMGSWMIDLVTDSVAMDARSREIYGVPDGTPFEDTLHNVHPDDRDLIRAEFARATGPADPDDTYRVEYRYRMPGGRYRWTLANGRATFQGEGPDRTPLRLDGVILDVDAVKRSEAELARALYQLNVVLEAARVGTWRGNVLEDRYQLDSRTQELCGLPPEARAADALPRVHPEDLERFQALIEAVDGDAPKGPFAHDIHMRGEDERYRWLAIRGRVAVDGTGRRWVDGVVLDVTPQREAEARVRRQLAEVESYFDAVPVGIAVLDREGRYVRVNRVLAAMNGVPPSKLIGERAQELWPKHAELNEPLVRRVLDTGVPVLNAEMRLPLPAEPDGPAYDWLVSFFPLRDGDDVRGVSVVIQDVTAIRAAEAELEAFAASLEQRVEERTQQVRRLAADLTHAEQAERQRLAEVLHDDLQQLLYALQIRAEILAGHLTTEDQLALSAELEDLLTRALTTTRSLTVDLSPPVLQGEGLEGSLRWLALQFKETQDFDVRIEGEATVVQPDIHTLLFRSVRELLFNVVKHAEASSATVRVSQNEHEITVDVTDDGVGFAAGEVVGRKAGFGLFSVRERLGLIGGSLDIESADGEGTRARITCPVDEAGQGTGAEQP